MYEQMYFYVNTIFSNYQCGFVSLETLLKKLLTEYDCNCRAWVNDDQTGAARLIMIIWFIYSKFDLSKSFHCVNHEIYVVRFATCCFISESPIFVWSYLTDQKQRIRINHSLNFYSDATCGVPLLCTVLTFVTCVFWTVLLTLVAIPWNIFISSWKVTKNK